MAHAALAAAVPPMGRSAGASPDATGPSRNSLMKKGSTLFDKAHAGHQPPSRGSDSDTGSSANAQSPLKGDIGVAHGGFAAAVTAEYGARAGPRGVRDAGVRAGEARW
eukprot:374014-Prymnesium_polylepis.2